MFLNHFFSLFYVAIACCSLYSSYRINYSAQKCFSFQSWAFNRRRTPQSGTSTNSPSLSPKKGIPRKLNPSKLKRPSPVKLPLSTEDHEEKIIKPVKSYARKTIAGQNIAICREFKIDSKKDFDFLGSFSNYESIPGFPLPEIAFVGRSNVGKSSLLNTISGLSKNIAVESKIPGRTQLINLFKCKDHEGDICIFADLPGYGYAKISKEQQEAISKFVSEYLENRTSLKLVVVLVDPRREPQENDRSMIKVILQLNCLRNNNINNNYRFYFHYRLVFDFHWTSCCSCCYKN
jgi:ribosome biogenesis GTP-binding protein YsxC/EngB